MSRLSFTVQQNYTGANNKLDYTFPFKIEEASQLIVVERNASGVETRRETGDNPVALIDTVVFDAEAGAGTVNLQANLATNYELDIFLANDAPTQPSIFRDKFSFTLKNIENALDWIGGAIQRGSFLAQRSVKLIDTIALSTFNIHLPSDLVGSASKVIITNSGGSAFIMGPTAGAIAGAEASATAAAASESAAAASATAAAASAVLAALEAPVETAISDSLGAATITGYTFVPTTVEWVRVEFSIYRGSTVVGSGDVHLIYDASAWHILEGSYNFPSGKSAAHGLTFSMSGNNMQVAADSGAGSGKLHTRAFQG